ncbi:MAG: hypothetical protein AAGJ35_02970 [Myxococcota bacterium]
MPVPNRFVDNLSKKGMYYQSGGPRLLALGLFVFGILLALWLSGAEIFYFRRVVPHLQTAPQEEFPDIPTQGLSRPWKALASSINKVFSLIRERGLGEADMKPGTGIATVDELGQGDLQSGFAALDYLQSSQSELPAPPPPTVSVQATTNAASFLNPSAPVPHPTQQQAQHPFTQQHPHQGQTQQGYPQQAQHPFTQQHPHSDQPFPGASEFKK